MTIQFLIRKWNVPGIVLTLWIQYLWHSLSIDNVFVKTMLHRKFKESWLILSNLAYAVMKKFIFSLSTPSSENLIATCFQVCLCVKSNLISREREISKKTLKIGFFIESTEIKSAWRERKGCLTPLHELDNFWSNLMGWNFSLDLVLSNMRCIFLPFAFPCFRTWQRKEWSNDVLLSYILVSILAVRKKIYQKENKNMGTRE